MAMEMHHEQVGSQGREGQGPLNKEPEGEPEPRVNVARVAALATRPSRAQSARDLA